MSTKTTFKRIALVAVAALGFGTLSVVPSQAAQLVSVTAAVAPATGTTSVAVRAVLSLNGYCDTTGQYSATNYISVWSKLPAASRVSLPAHGALSAAEGTAYSSATTNYGPTDTGLAFSGAYQSVGKQWIAANNDKVTQANASYVYCNTVGRYAQLVAVSFTPDVAGTYEIMTFDPTNASSQSFWTIVVTDPTVKSTTAFLNTTLGSASTADATAANLTFAATASSTAKARLDVKQWSTTDTTTAAVAAITQDVVVAISRGLVSKTNDYSGGAASVTEAGKVAGAIDSDYYVFANGTVGSASLTVTVGGVLVATKAIVFNGAATTLSAALTTGQATWIAPLGTTTVTVTAKDSAGNAATSVPTLTATSGTTTVATVAVDNTTKVVTITGVAAGTSVITIADSATTSPAASTTYTVTVAPAVSATLPTITFDKADYAPGELMTITIAAAAADNASFAAFTAKPVVSVNVVTATDPFTLGAVALVGGKATMKAYAPANGNVTITATSSTGSSATAATVTATATVSNEALDAASEAIDAANAATDAANAAAEAADAATAAAQDAADAVAALSLSVEAMITALKKQITALTNLVIKIQKKVKA